MTTDPQAATKVTADHLRRNAYLYVRQSTLRQVLHNTASTQRQYDLRGRAIALGWTAEQLIVIDTDQGQSGASAADRDGFQHLVAEVGMGHAGIVLGRVEQVRADVGQEAVARARVGEDLHAGAGALQFVAEPLGVGRREAGSVVGQVQPHVAAGEAVQVDALGSPQLAGRIGGADGQHARADRGRPQRQRATPVVPEGAHLGAGDQRVAHQEGGRAVDVVGQRAGVEGEHGGGRLLVEIAEPQGHAAQEVDGQRQAARPGQPLGGGDGVGRQAAEVGQQQHPRPRGLRDGQQALPVAAGGGERHHPGHDASAPLRFHQDPGLQAVLVVV
jgi:hypothetical protein